MFDNHNWGIDNILSKYTFRQITLCSIVLILSILVIIQLLPSNKSILFNSLAPIVNFFVFFLLLLYSNHLFVNNDKSKYAWLFITIGVGFNLIAEIIWLILTNIIKIEAFPSIADPFYLLYYPFVALGIILLGTRSDNIYHHIKTYIDVLISLTAFFLVIWSFVAAPLVYHSSYDSLSITLEIVYVFGDTFILFAISYVLLNFLKNKTGFSIALLFIIISIFFQIIADFFFSYLNINNLYLPGNVFDNFFILSYLFMGLAVVAMIKNTKSNFKPIFISKIENWDGFTYFPIIIASLVYLVLIIFYNKLHYFNFYSLIICVGIIFYLVLIRQILSTKEISEQRKELTINQRNLEKSLNEKTVLLKEIHHRVKNNMQIISSLIELQTLNSEPEFRDLFKDIQGRVMSMALIHEKLYKTNELSDIYFQDYALSLTNEIIGSYNLQKSIESNIIIDKDIYLKLEIAIPLGLIINELITNSIKHGFSEGKSGTIFLKSELEEEYIILTYQDDGKGLTDDFNLKNSSTIGMLLIEGLVNQIEGELIIKNNPVIFIIKFDKGVGLN